MPQHTSLDWAKDWDAAAGLWWWNSAGHTASVADRDRVHCVPDAASRLLVAAQVNALDQVDVTAVLRAIHACRIQDGASPAARFPWYVEEERISDDHGTFFTGLPLCALHGAYRDRLSPEAREMLRGMFRDLLSATCRNVVRGHIYYPNEFLGDWACAWLAGEFLGDVAHVAELLGWILRAADYWQDDGWGWGEHLSDGYANVCLDELSLLLLCAQTIPDAQRDRLRELFSGLLRLDDEFAGGPRVPAVRQYAFASHPSGLRYRDHVRPVPADARFDLSECLGKRLPTCCGPRQTVSGPTWLPMAQTWSDLGWHDMAPGPRRRRAQVTIPCTAGAKAMACVRPHVRLGSLSRFPLMPSAEYPAWGLSWQSFPVALWTPSGAWGYLQWETVENGETQSHPAPERYLAYRRKTLAGSVLPPIVGRTYSIQHGGDLLVLRVMPMICAGWERLTDRFRLLGGDVLFRDGGRDGQWSQGVVSCGGIEINLQGVRLSGGPGPEPSFPNPGLFDWSISLDKGQLAGRRALVTLWGVSLSGALAESPHVEVDPEASPMPRGAEALALRVHWAWPERTWDVTIDLLSTRPLREQPQRRAQSGS